MKYGSPRFETHYIYTVTFPFLIPRQTLLTRCALKSHFETPTYVYAQRHTHARTRSPQEGCYIAALHTVS